MHSKLFMGIDIGTSSVRAAIFDLDGKQISISQNEYPMICTEQGMGELDPEVVFGNLIQVVKNCIEKLGGTDKKIEAIGISTQMHSFMAVDKNGRPLTNVITWADSRPVSQAEQIEKIFDYKMMYYNTGCRVQHPMYPLSKILWLKETKPDVYKNAYKFITIKEYVLFKLYGHFVVDFTDASATGCFNIHSFEWDKYILENVLEIDKSMFGEPVECTFILKNMNRDYAKAMDLDPDTPVAIGSGDGILANVGCGVFDDTSMTSTVGTSGAMRISVNAPLLDPSQKTWCYCFTRNTWVAGGAINNGGIVLRWIRDSFRKQFEREAEEAGIKSIYALFDKYAEKVSPGSDGLIFLPFLTGERSPNWNANAQGTLHGLQLLHTREHLVRSAMEGVMYRMFSVYEAITRLNNNVRQIKANGGYIKSDIWLKIQADIFNKEIAVAGIGEAAVFGAAYTAMVAVGAINGFNKILPEMQPLKVVKPNPENVEVYRNAYNRFKDLYCRIYDVK
ncbi:MAG TPA: gluconokinase [Clostridiaceae bacterium]|nr:gluconokinase [Clostridiaceae bacterium]